MIHIIFEVYCILDHKDNVANSYIDKLSTSALEYNYDNSQYIRICWN